MTFSVTYVNRPADTFVLGLSVRTSKAEARHDIPALWDKLFREGWLERLPPAEDGAIHAVYTDYESDETGPYTMVLGVSVTRDVRVPAGLRRVAIPAGEHAVLRVEGDPEEVVFRTWEYVCTGFEGRARRRYSADFERYDLEHLRPGHARVEIAVGLSPA